MAVVLESSKEYTAANTTTLTYSFTHVITSGINKALFVQIAESTNWSDTPTSVVFGASSLTLMAENLNAGALCANRIYYLLDPPSGTGTLVITTPAASRIAASSYYFSGVNQSTPYSNIKTSATFTVSVTTSSNGLAVYFATIISASASFSAVIGQTQINHFLSAGTVKSAASTENTADTAVMAWQVSGVGTTPTIVAFALNHAVAGLALTSFGGGNVYHLQVDAEIVGTGLSAGQTFTYKGVACTAVSASGSTSVKVTLPSFWTNNIKLGVHNELKVVD